MKEGRVRKNWKKRFFRINSLELRYSKSSNPEVDESVKGRIRIEDITLVERIDNSVTLEDKSTSLTYKGFNLVFCIHTPERKLFCQANSEFQLNNWLNAIKTAIEVNQYYAIFKVVMENANLPVDLQPTATEPQEPPQTEKKNLTTSKRPHTIQLEDIS